MPHTTRTLLLLLLTWITSQPVSAEGPGGDPAAIADARAMVETMGGLTVWSQLESLHFVHEWDFVNREDRYLENEILDLTGPRSWVSMKSEVYDRVRAYSPEFGYWSINDGEVTTGNEESMNNAMERAPFSIYRLARSIARNEPSLRIHYGSINGIQGPPALEFRDQGDVPRGWILLNARKEPLIWATTQYVYVFGPLARFGNLLVPDWATTSNGLVRYQMVSLIGSDKRPDTSLFAPPG